MAFERQRTRYHPRDSGLPAFLSGTASRVGGKENDHAARVSVRDFSQSVPRIKTSRNVGSRRAEIGSVCFSIAAGEVCLQLEAPTFYNFAFCSAVTWRKAWVLRKRAKVGANSVKRSAVCELAFAIVKANLRENQHRFPRHRSRCNFAALFFLAAPSAWGTVAWLRGVPASYSRLTREANRA